MDKKPFVVIIVLVLLSSLLTGCQLASTTGTTSYTKMVSGACILYDGQGSCQVLTSNCNTDGSQRSSTMSCGCNMLTLSGYLHDCKRIAGSACHKPTSGLQYEVLCGNSDLYTALDPQNVLNYYCYISGAEANPTYKLCDSGCDSLTGDCKAPSETPTIGVCTNGYMKCSSGSTYKCIGYQWVKQETCTSSSPCTEVTYNNAVCKSNNEFCPNTAQANCITCNDGYSTLEECIKHVNYYCYDSLTNTCTEKTGIGNCPTGQNKYYNSGACEAIRVSHAVCRTNSECNDQNICTQDNCVTTFLTTKCENTIIPNCGDKQLCLDKNPAGIPFYKWEESSVVSGGYVCQWFGLGCTTTDTSQCKPNVIIWVFAAIIAVGALAVFFPKLLKKVVKK